jgi:hypothetical protein
LTARDELWKLLMAITLHKPRNLANEHQSQEESRRRPRECHLLEGE